MKTSKLTRRAARALRGVRARMSALAVRTRFVPAPGARARTVPALAVLVLVALALPAVLAACGSSTPSEAPSTIYPESSPTGTVPALRAYLNDAQDVLGQVATTVGALPGAVDGMSTRPDDTWAASAAQLQSIAAQLGDEAAALAALQPPSTLQPVQDAVVKGIQAAQSGIEKLAARVESGQQRASARSAEIRSRAAELRAQIDGLVQQLQGALGGLTGQ